MSTRGNKALLQLLFRRYYGRSKNENLLKEFLSTIQITQNFKWISKIRCTNIAFESGILTAVMIAIRVCTSKFVSAFGCCGKYIACRVCVRRAIKFVCEIHETVCRIQDYRSL